MLETKKLNKKRSFFTIKNKYCIMSTGVHTGCETLFGAFNFKSGYHIIFFLQLFLLPPFSFTLVIASSLKKRAQTCFLYLNNFIIIILIICVEIFQLNGNQTTLGFETITSDFSCHCSSDWAVLYKFFGHIYTQLALLIITSGLLTQTAQHQQTLEKFSQTVFVILILIKFVFYILNNLMFITFIMLQNITLKMISC